jgi:integrase
MRESSSKRVKPYSVLGPYAERKGWRVRVYVNGQEVECKCFDDRQDALAFMQAQEDKLSHLQHRALRDVLEEWTQYKVCLGTCKPESAYAATAILRLFLRDELDLDIRDLTAKRAAEIYNRAVMTPTEKTGAPLSVASRKLYTAHAKMLFAWAHERSYIRVNPFADIKVIGKMRRGKPQLRIDEARRFIDTALRYYTETRRPLAVAVAAALFMGLRTGELLDRQVRDLEDGGRYLCIDRGKSQNATRRPEVPEPLRPYLLDLASQRGPSEPLFGYAAGGVKWSRQVVHVMTQRICTLAGVPIVCTHSLRGLFATLAVQTGAATHAVAAALGHGSFTMTARHYAQAGALANAQVARVADVLCAPSPAPAPAAPVLSGLTAAQLAALLDPAQLAQLRALLTAKRSQVCRDPSARPSRNTASRRRTRTPSSSG